MLRRGWKALAHETGHMFGFDHCGWYRYLMNGFNHPAESDARPLHLCPVDLRKLQWSIGFDVVEHYRLLRDFQRQVGFEDEAQRLDKRIRFISQREHKKESLAQAGIN
jgi:archaemetzincin